MPPLPLPPGILGFWCGGARNGSITYDVSLAITGGAAGERIGLFYVPNPYFCAGTQTFHSTSDDVVYKETYVFGTMANRGPPGTTTLTQRSADTLDYAFYDGKKTDRGTLNRRARGGNQVPAVLTGLWSGALAGTTSLGTVRVVVGDGAAGDTIAQVLYPSRTCATVLALGSAAATTVVASEAVIGTAPSCTNGAQVTLTAGATTGAIDMAWSLSGATSSGSLGRQR